MSPPPLGWAQPALKRETQGFTVFGCFGVLIETQRSGFDGERWTRERNGECPEGVSCGADFAPTTAGFWPPTTVGISLI